MKPSKIFDNSGASFKISGIYCPYALSSMNNITFCLSFDRLKIGSTLVADVPDVFFVKSLYPVLIENILNIDIDNKASAKIDNK